MQQQLSPNLFNACPCLWHDANQHHDSQWHCPISLLGTHAHISLFTSHLWSQLDQRSIPHCLRMRRQRKESFSWNLNFRLCGLLTWLNFQLVTLPTMKCYQRYMSSYLPTRVRAVCTWLLDKAKIGLSCKTVIFLSKTRCPYLSIHFKTQDQNSRTESKYQWGKHLNKIEDPNTLNHSGMIANCNMNCLVANIISHLCPTSFIGYILQTRLFNVGEKKHKARSL